MCRDVGKDLIQEDALDLKQTKNTSWFHSLHQQPITPNQQLTVFCTHYYGVCSCCFIRLLTIGNQTRSTTILLLFYPKRFSYLGTECWIQWPSERVGNHSHSSHNAGVGLKHATLCSQSQFPKLKAIKILLQDWFCFRHRFCPFMPACHNPSISQNGHCPFSRK